MVMEETTGSLKPRSRKRTRDEASPSDSNTGIVRQMEKKTSLVLVFQKETLNKLEELGLSPPRPKVARVQGRPSKRLTMSLYRERLMELKRNSGITLNTARYIRYIKNLSWEPMSLYRKEVEKFNRERGILWWQVRSIDKVSTAALKYVPLLGHLEGNKKMIISKAWIPSDKDTMEVMMIFPKSLFGPPK